MPKPPYKPRITRCPLSSFENRIPRVYITMRTAMVPNKPRKKAISPDGILEPSIFTNKFIVLNKSADSSAYIRPFLAILPPYTLYYSISNSYYSCIIYMINMLYRRYEIYKTKIYAALLAKGGIVLFRECIYKIKNFLFHILFIDCFCETQWFRF